MIAAPFEKTYLSRAQSRIWSMENPVGDPFGGPAYGQKEEPVSMIAAVVAIGVGASTVAAATTLTLTAVMGGLMIAGGAASLIGTVSGNKQLSMIGGIVAGVGGLGLGAANMFADAAATTSIASEGATAAGAASSEATALETGGAMANGSEAVVQPVSESATSIVPTATETTAASYQAPNVAYDPSSITAPASAGTVDSPSLASNLLDQGGAGQVAMNEGLINSATPDSTYQQIFDQAGSDVNNMLADNSNLQQYASNQGTTDVPLGSTPSADGNQTFDLQNLPADYRQRAVDSMKALGIETPPQAEGQTPFPTAASATQAEGQTPFPTANTPPSNDAPSGSWLDKVEGIAKGIEKYKTTAMLGGNLISGAMKYAIPSQLDQATIDAYNAKANLANAEANALAAAEDRRRRQNEAVKNLKPVQLNNASNPIFGTALSGAGIINSARA